MQGCMDNNTDATIVASSIIYAIENINPFAIIIYGKIPHQIKECCYNNDVKIINFDGETASFYKRKEEN